MTNDEVRALLERLRSDALSPYPFPDGSEIDPRYAMALGLIGGIATDALAAVAEDRPLRITERVCGGG